MAHFAYLDFLVITGGPEKAGSQWCFITLEGCGFPLAMAAGWGITACVGPFCLADRVLEGYMFSGLPLATREGWGCYMVYFMDGCQIRDLK